MRDRLFANDSLREFLLSRLRSVTEAVERCNDNQVRTDPDAVVDMVVRQLDVKAIDVDWASKRADPLKETTLERSHGFDGGVFGTRVPARANKVTWHVPYSGTYEVLNYRASTYRSIGDNAKAVGAEIEYSVELPQGAGPAEFLDQTARIEDQINESVGWANADIAEWQPTLVDAVRRAVADRRKYLLDQVSLAQALNIPVRRAPAEQTITIPVVAKKIVPVSDTPTAPAAPEPAITQAIYDDIVGTLRGVGNSFERLPRTAEQFDEEELRDLLLFILNSNYQGAVGGEMFNGSGKTDVLLRWQDRNAFIGECKFWKGSKAFSAAIDQLLGYTVWRDTKAALVLSIKNSNASEIIEKADQAIRDHACFIQAIDSADPDGRLNYLMHAKDDPERTIQVALLPIVIRQRA